MAQPGVRAKPKRFVEWLNGKFEEKKECREWDAMEE